MQNPFQSACHLAHDSFEKSRIDTTTKANFSVNCNNRHTVVESLQQLRIRINIDLDRLKIVPQERLFCRFAKMAFATGIKYDIMSIRLDLRTIRSAAKKSQGRGFLKNIIANRKFHPPQATTHQIRSNPHCCWGAFWNANAEMRKSSRKLEIPGFTC